MYGSLKYLPSCARYFHSEEKQYIYIQSIKNAFSNEQEQ